MRRPLVRRFFVRQLAFARRLVEQYPDSQFSGALRNWLAANNPLATNDELVAMDKMLSEPPLAGSLVPHAHWTVVP
jgi:hypothetical protein